MADQLAGPRQDRRPQMTATRGWRRLTPLDCGAGRCSGDPRPACARPDPLAILWPLLTGWRWRWPIWRWPLLWRSSPSLCASRCSGDPLAADGACPKPPFCTADSRDECAKATSAVTSAVWYQGELYASPPRRERLRRRSSLRCAAGPCMGREARLRGLMRLSSWTAGDPLDRGHP